MALTQQIDLQLICANCNLLCKSIYTASLIIMQIDQRTGTIIRSTVLSELYFDLQINITIVQAVTGNEGDRR